MGNKSRLHPISLKIMKRAREGSECPICLSSKVEPVTLVCGHQFCKLCLRRLHQLTCPMCRADFDAARTYGVDVNKTRQDGHAPLHMAAEIGDAKIVHMLIQSGANVNVVNTATPLALAAKVGHAEVVQTLLQAGADINLVSPVNKSSPLHLACFQGHTEIVKMLVEAGANLEAREINQVTPLHLAVINVKEEVVDILLRAGANPNAETNRGSTTMHLAVESQNVQVLQVLLKFTPT